MRQSSSWYGNPTHEYITCEQGERGRKEKKGKNEVRKGNKRGPSLREFFDLG
jgi:hypothetical protein